VTARPIHRYISFFIDLLVTGAVSFLVSYPAIITFFEALAIRNYNNISNLLFISLLCGAIVTILDSAYYLVLPLVWKYQTIGRFLTRIAIVKEDGEKVDFKTLFVREVICRMLAGFVSLGLSILADGYLIGVQRSSFSDALAHTKVIDI
jgi:uncharacterized RDD family membrane protein YckC